MKEAVATYLATAAEKLRDQKSVAGAVQVYIATNPFSPNQPQYTQSMTVTIPQPSAYTPLLLKAALRCLDSIFKPGFQYKKAGVMLTEIMPDSYRQQNLFDSEGTDKLVLMMAVDAINRKWGRQTVQLVAAGVKNSADGSVSQISRLHQKLVGVAGGQGVNQQHKVRLVIR